MKKRRNPPLATHITRGECAPLPGAIRAEDTPRGKAYRVWLGSAWSIKGTRAWAAAISKEVKGKTRTNPAFRHTLPGTYMGYNLSWDYPDAKVRRVQVVSPEGRYVTETKTIKEAKEYIGKIVHRPQYRPNPSSGYTIRERSDGWVIDKPMSERVGRSAVSGRVTSPTIGPFTTKAAATNFLANITPAPYIARKNPSTRLIKVVAKKDKFGYQIVQVPPVLGGDFIVQDHQGLFINRAPTLAEAKAIRTSLWRYHQMKGQVIGNPSLRKSPHMFHGDDEHEMRREHRSKGRRHKTKHGRGAMFPISSTEGQIIYSKGIKALKASSKVKQMVGIKRKTQSILNNPGYYAGLDK